MPTHNVPRRPDFLQDFGCLSAQALRIELTLTLLTATLVAAWVLPIASASAEPLRVDTAAEKKNYPEFEEAKQKLSKQDIDGALAAFNAAAKAHPELANGRVLLASVYFASNRPRDGRFHLEKAVVENPDDPEAYLIMADLAGRELQWTDAGLLAEKAITLAKTFKGDPERKKDMLKRGYLLAALVAQQHEQWEDARKLLADLLKSNNDVALAHFRLGQVLFELKKQKEAYAELQAASRLDEEIPSAEITMAQLYDKGKDRASAEKWIKQAVTADPKRAKTRLEAAQFLLRTGNLDEAKEQVNEALKLEPDSQDALFLAGRIARYAKDYGQAQKYLERSYLESPGAGVVANELALTLNEMGEEDRKRALTLAEATYRQVRDAESASTLAWICFRLGRMEDAERVFNAIPASSQASPDAIYFFAAFADDRNRGEMARPLLEAALKSDGPFAYRADAQKLFERLSKRPSSASRGAKGKPETVIDVGQPTDGEGNKPAAKAAPPAKAPGNK